MLHFSLSLSLSLSNIHSRYPVLLQGPTSAGKTSLVQYLAKVTGHRCVRVNNHEHTDLQEYIGMYSTNIEGRLEFKEGTNIILCSSDQN